MKRHSLLVKLNILFIVALVATLLAGFFVGMGMVKKDQVDLLFKARLLLKEMRITKSTPTELLNEFDLVELRGKKKQHILKKAVVQTRPHRSPNKFVRMFHKHHQVLSFKGHRYLHLRPHKMNVLLEDKHSFFDRFMLPIVIWLATLVLLLVMYLLLRKSIKPLKTLQKDIVSYGEGEAIAYRHSERKDEVSLASNAFYDSVQKVEQLRDSRQLFIRNIFHELNTPVTKGKILAEIVEETKTKEMLNSIFTRLSTLLRELAQMEKITSQSFSIEPKPLRVIELIDEASDLLYLETPVETNVTDEMIKADFAAMSIVFKNLIDNALKYGSNLRIEYSEDRIVFSSKGEPLKHHLSHYTQAFSKGDEVPSDKGFGLGLYIVHEILSKHGMTLSYGYKAGVNTFTINLKNNL